MFREAETFGDVVGTFQTILDFECNTLALSSGHLLDEFPIIDHIRELDNMTRNISMVLIIAHVKALRPIAESFVVQRTITGQDLKELKILIDP